MGASSDEPTDQHSGSAASSEANYRSDLLANRTSHPEFPFCLSVSADYTPNSLWLCLGFFPSRALRGHEGPEWPPPSTKTAASTPSQAIFGYVAVPPYLLHGGTLSKQKPDSPMLIRKRDAPIRKSLNIARAH